MQAGLNPITASPAAPGGSQTSLQHARLEKAAHQFEAMMLHELMKPLSNSAAPGEEDDASDKSGPLQSFGTDAVASALAQTGALGFASRLVHALERRSAAAQGVADSAAPLPCLQEGLSRG